MVKILDCTLRDGGYINNWDFSKKNSKEIIKLLKLANIDYIEAGFYHHNLAEILPENCVDILAMVQYSKTDINKIPVSCQSKIKGLRVIFKKFESNNALEFCKKIKDKGYKLFINATFISQYKDDELIDLIKKINQIAPFAFTVTDSMGVFTSFDIKKIASIVSLELNSEIALCFHSHNNLGLSFSNAQTLIELTKNRELIVDSSLFGMGRGAGNLKTELIAQYLNKKGANYDCKFLLNAIDKFIEPIYQKTPWGYSIPYYLSALNKCHPDYAKFLIEKNVEINRMDKIFSSIPLNKKAVYDAELIAKQFV
ncbi:MAG: hypothetical protein IJ877_02725 [Candidatus Gastranaerophilales bacterium]|nr:hypothetical protein [Candidatus Gastranaerophilales bacterium]